MKITEENKKTDLVERRRDYLLPFLLMLLILCPCLVFAWVDFTYTADLRKENTLLRNAAIAQLCARLIDGQWNSALLVLQALEKRRSLRNALAQSDKRALQHELKDAVELGPDLLFVATYQPDGNFAASYPEITNLPQHAEGTEWFQKVSAGAQVVVTRVKPVLVKDGNYAGEVRRGFSKGATDAIILTVPVRTGARNIGYLLAYYRMGESSIWLQNTRATDGRRLFVVDRQGHAVTATGRLHWSNLRFDRYAPFQAALHGGVGGAKVREIGSREEALVGYAYADRPDWAVLVEQPTARALAPVYALAFRLSLLVFPVVVLMFIGIYALVHLYRQANRMATLLTQQNNALITADRAKSDFLANVSHDLRTPLASLSISLSGLLDPDIAWSREEIRNSLQLASEGLAQLTARVRNLLDMARLEAGVYPMRLEPADLTDIVGGALERLKPLLQDRVLTTDFPNQPLLIECDQAQIETVIVNLVENAAKYSPANTSIFLYGAAVSECVEFTITDEGPGIPPGDEAHVFEKFYRGQATRAIGGTGLGLTICKSTIEAHGGSIGIRCLSEGTQFWFVLPRLQFAGKIADE